MRAVRPRPESRHRVRVTGQLGLDRIADRVGASREMVARILKDLTIGEYIRFEGRHIIINTRLPAKY